MKDYINFVLHMTKETKDQSVKKVLDLLAEKYARTKKERCLDLATEVFELRWQKMKHARHTCRDFRR